MPQTIKILPENLANKIAAGEVVQRPAAAVKELLENSIDAGARVLTLVIKNGGKSLIQLIDDGAGMSREDAVLAFQRHATSKISSFEDLENIRTLGFRGEALASIAAVSHVEMRTKRGEDEVGTRVRIEGGEMKESSREAVPAGTSITLRNLFYNTPGRRNFLKSDSTELKHVIDAVQRIALSHPALSLKFVSNDEVILDLRPSDLGGRVRAIFGEPFARKIFAFQDDGQSARLHGFLGLPALGRKTRAEQYIFLNNRFIINRNLNHAVFKAYEHLLEKGSFPFFILCIDIDARRLDVNVHPSKLEVKFDDEGSMYRIVHSAVRRALSEHDLIPSAGFREEPAQVATANLRLKPEAGSPGGRVTNWRELIRTPAPRVRESGSSSTDNRGFSSEPEIDSRAQFPDAVSATLLWQVHDKYIMTPIEGGVMVVDQHAAHERVIYERVVKRFGEANAKVQQLLFPQTVELTPADAAMVGELLPLLERIGFSVKMFGKTTMIVDGVPVDVKPGAEKTILQDMLDLIKEDEQNTKLEAREKLAKSFSCRAAVKAGDPLTPPEMRSLLDQLFATKVPYVCPHGRPVMIKFSLAELDRKFGRTS
ncbi:MAG TPA: DNA mismatch repair endonuclease MutL [Bacteroidota bacterium]|nr:DNA mismatch repair endonuclease MutL [Bacteroidota bacterium]